MILAEELEVVLFKLFVVETCSGGGVHFVVLIPLGDYAVDLNFTFTFPFVFVGADIPKNVMQHGKFPPCPVALSFSHYGDSYCIT